MVHKVKEFRPPIKGTIVCKWCGCTNHSGLLKEGQIPFYRIDGWMGCGPCWNIVKRTLVAIGLMTDDTEMRKTTQIIKKNRSVRFFSESEI